MLLASARLVGLGPFDDMTFRFAQEGAAPRPVTAIFGGGGVGKTTLLHAIASTRPGLSVAQPRGRSARLPHAAAMWVLGQDEPSRPHPLRIISPNAQPEGPEEQELPLRREQARYDKRATEGGFVLQLFQSTRWFSRSPSLLTSPDRTVARYDVRAAHGSEDASRGDLARETKQALCYASIAAALAQQQGEPQRRFSELDEAMHRATSALTGLMGYAFVGADPATLEPLFADASGATLPFDELPTAARHLAAFGALTVRALFAAYPGAHPLGREGVALIDEIGLHQEPSVARRLPSALRRALPSVQWIFTTSSPDVASACNLDELLTLRRASPTRVELHEGDEAITH